MYGHLSEILVEVGDRVKDRQPIAKVGMSGVAVGSHLHFEVRQGENAYRSTQNPELWLSPHRGTDGSPNGAIAGRIETEHGQKMHILNLVIERLTGPKGDPIGQVFLETYPNTTFLGHPELEENFALGDLAAGWYRVSFVARGLQTRELEVLPGHVTFVKFRVAVGGGN